MQCNRRFMLTLGGISVAATMLVPASVLCAEAAAPKPAEAAVLAFEQERCDAVQRRDRDALARMLADDLTYVHASGLRQGKQEYLDYVAAGKVTYTSFEIHNALVRVSGKSAVTHGVFQYEIAGNPARRGSMLYTGVYSQVSGSWKLVAWEATGRKE